MRQGIVREASGCPCPISGATGAGMWMRKHRKLRLWSHLLMIPFADEHVEQRRRIEER